MSLLPLFFDVDDLAPRERFLKRWPNESYYLRPWRLCREALAQQDEGSQIVKNKEGFHVNLDVRQFAPEEINVKTTSNEIIVEGEHEEKQDEHGYISRKFSRRYVLPEGHDLTTAKSTLSSDGVLSVSVQRNQLPGEETKSIPITHTGQAHRKLKEKPQIE